VIKFLARTARDPAVRKEAVRRAHRLLGIDGDGRLHRDAVAPDLTETVLVVAAEDGDEHLMSDLVARLGRKEEASIRSNLVATLAAFRKPELAARARALVLTETLHGWEPEMLIANQIASPFTRDDAWQWLMAHGGQLLARFREVPVRQWVLSNAGYLCDSARSAEIDAYLAELAPQVEGGQREAASARERARLCAKQREVLLPALRSFFLQAAHPSRTR
jgi:hypothetical protein